MSGGKKPTNRGGLNAGITICVFVLVDFAQRSRSATRAVGRSVNNPRCQNGADTGAYNYAAPPLGDYEPLRSGAEGM